MVSRSRRVRSFGLLLSLCAAGSAAALANCSAPAEEEQALSADAVTGVNNALGLSLVYDEESGKVHATLRDALDPRDRLYIRVRRGTITHESQEKLDCSELSHATPIPRRGENLGQKTLYQGPAVSRELVDLIEIYNDARWYGGHETAEMQAEVDKGPDPIVEACIVRDGKPRAKLLTNLAYAWDRGHQLARQLGLAPGEGLAPSSRMGGGLHFADTDAGLNGDGGTDDGSATEDAGSEGDGGAEGGAPVLREGDRLSTIDYANLCVQELGDIPFFKKLEGGKYDSFDCRDAVGTNADGASQGPIEGVENRMIPLTVDDREQTECSEGRRSERSYDCVDKCDRGMYLTASSHTGLGRSAACQPGVTVTTAKNARGTHWVLLCRKVDNGNGESMTKTKVFNDIAIIGNNPDTGKTCFFQNKENVGNDGARVVHPADVARSSAIWPASPSSYCTGNCHAADAFVHSPWIDQAKRRDGHTIVPKMGELSDYPISDLTRPYYLVNGEPQGFSVPKQLVSEEAAACTTCHRVAGAAFAEFAEWATGTGDPYFNKITESHKSFPNAYWMPPRLDGLNGENFASSNFGKAVTHIRKCMDNNSAEGCEFADIPTR